MDFKGKSFLKLLDFSPLEIEDYGLGVNYEGKYRVVFDTLEDKYGGVGVNERTYKSESVSRHGKENSINIKLRGNEGLLIKLVK